MSTNPSPLKTVAQTLDDLRTQPGVDVSKLKIGTKILVETTQAVYEFEVVAPSIAMLDITGTDPRLHQKLTGQLVASHLDIAGQIGLPTWIGKNLRMQLKFKNDLNNCSPAIYCKVSGDGWEYEVF